MEIRMGDIPVAAEVHMQRFESAPAERAGLMMSLECSLSKHGKTFLASCDQLGVSDQGRSAEEAIRNLRTTLGVFLKEFPEAGVLKKVLNERHVQFTSIHADRVMPEMMDVPQILAEVDAVGTPAVESPGQNESRRISVSAYLWSY